MGAAAGVGAVSQSSFSQPLTPGVAACVWVLEGPPRAPYAGVRPPARGSGVRPPSFAKEPP